MIETPERFGLLTVIGRASGPRSGYRLCRCDCGTEKPVRIDHLRSGRTISCGCEHSRRSSARTPKLHKANTTHGLSRSRIYDTWSNMKSRCQNPNNVAYKYYGGRGIAVCERWQRFENFIADMGFPDDDQEIDRIDNDGNYEPGNCRWATRRQQQNHRRVNKYIEYRGHTRTVSEWARIMNIHRNTLDKRLATGVPIPEALKKGKREMRQRTHCNRGHLFTEDNTLFQANGARICRTCRNARARRYTAEKSKAARPSSAPLRLRA